MKIKVWDSDGLRYENLVDCFNMTRKIEMTAREGDTLEPIWSFMASHRQRLSVNKPLLKAREW